MEPNNEREEIAQKKFDTCKYRSLTEVEVGSVSCCSNTLHMAYVCFRRNIEDLNKAYCLDCKFYKERNVKRN